MGKEKKEENENVFEFEKTKGFGAYNFIWHNTIVTLEEASLSVEHTRKVIFRKGKTNCEIVNYNDLDKIELKNNFAKSDLISGIIVGIISIATVQIWGLLFTGLLVFFAYSKNIVIVRKDGSKLTILNGGVLSGGRKGEFNRMIPILNEKMGREVYNKPAKK